MQNVRNHTTERAQVSDDELIWIHWWGPDRGPREARKSGSGFFFACGQEICTLLELNEIIGGSNVRNLKNRTHLRGVRTLWSGRVKNNTFF